MTSTVYFLSFLLFFSMAFYTSSVVFWDVIFWVCFRYNIYLRLICSSVKMKKSHNIPLNQVTSYNACIDVIGKSLSLVYSAYKNPSIIGGLSISWSPFTNLFFSNPGDISSLSGSESSCQSDNDIDEEPNSAGQRHVFALHQSQNNTDDSVAIKQRTFPRVFFRNSEGQLISVHRCILHGKKVR